MYLQLTPVQSARINRDGGDVHSTTAQAGAVFPLRYAQSERGVGSPPKGDEAGPADSTDSGVARGVGEPSEFIAALGESGNSPDHTSSERLAS